MEEGKVKSIIDNLNNSTMDTPETRVVGNSIPQSTPSSSTAFKPLNSSIDPDLIVNYEVVSLPSEGKFYSNGLSELNVEYLTALDEDILTTPSLIQNGTVLDVLLKRKIKTHGINASDLLSGDREAIILYLRMSSYGNEYGVSVHNPYYGGTFKTTVDLGKLKYKKITEIPDAQGCFIADLPMSKKKIQFRLLTSGEENTLFKQSQSLQEAYNQEYSTFNTLKLKASVKSIDGNSDRSYISNYVDVMKAGDSTYLKKRIKEVAPGVDMTYEFTSPEGNTFVGQLEVGADFFFPAT